MKPYTYTNIRHSHNYFNQGGKDWFYCIRDRQLIRRAHRKGDRQMHKKACYNDED